MRAAPASTCTSPSTTTPGPTCSATPAARTACLALAAIGAAVLLGIQDKAEPPPKLEGYGYDPARSRLLPARLGEALDALEADRELAGVLGDYFVTSFLAYKRNEIER